MTKIGLVGFGKLGLLYASLANSNEKTKLEFIVENNILINLFLKRRFLNVKIYKNINKALNECKVDICIICTPSSSHFHIAQEIIKKGVNVFIEKPQTTNFESPSNYINLRKNKYQ